MKEKVLIFLLICISFNIQAQKCKFDYEKKDPFTGEMTLGKTSTLEKSWKIGFYRTNNNYQIGLFVNFSGVKEDVINIGDTLIIALENGEKIKLISIGKALPVSNVVGSGQYSQIQTYYQPGYLVDPEQIKLLSLNKIIAIKIYFGIIWNSIEVSSKNTEKIIQSAKCILK